MESYETRRGEIVDWFEQQLPDDFAAMDPDRVDFLRGKLKLCPDAKIRDELLGWLGRFAELDDWFDRVKREKK